MTIFSEKTILGLDLGGSSIKVAVLEFNTEGNPMIVTTESRNIHPSRTPRRIIEDLCEVKEEFKNIYGEFDAIGLGMPGLLNDDSGVTTHLSNFPMEWEGYFFRDELKARFAQEVTISNDARAFSVAESVLGVAAGLDTVICVVLGTGVGGGVVIGGRLWKGTGSAGELGHQTVELNGPICGCGNRGCIESIAGSSAIISAGGKSSVHEVFQAAKAGDDLARTAVSRAISALAAGLGNAYLVLAPDAIVVGGGIADAGAQLFDPLIKAIHDRVRTVPSGSIRILKAKLGVFAGAVGAALLAAESINS